MFNLYTTFCCIQTVYQCVSVFCLNSNFPLSLNEKLDHRFEFFECAKFSAKSVFKNLRCLVLNQREYFSQLYLEQYKQVLFHATLT